MIKMENDLGFLRKPDFVTLCHESDKVLVFTKADLVWVFNWHH